MSFKGLHVVGIQATKSIDDQDSDVEMGEQDVCTTGETMENDSNHGSESEGEGDNDSGSESEEEDEGSKRYWAVKSKKSNSKVRCHKLCACCVWLTSRFELQQRPRKSHATRNLRLCYMKDAREINGVVIAGHYCQFCL